MAYKFNFDLSKLSQSFFTEVAKASDRTGVHKKVGYAARYLVNKFKINKIIGISVSDALTVVEDLINTYVKNLSQKEAFEKTKRRANNTPPAGPLGSSSRNS